MAFTLNVAGAPEGTNKDCGSVEIVGGGFSTTTICACVLVIRPPGVATVRLTE